MKVSHKWLQDYFDKKLPDPKTIAHELTFKAFEIEELTEKGDDWIFDVKVLPNRAHDSLSHRGLAKEISAIFDLPLSDDPLRRPLSELPASQALSIAIDNPDLCERYVGALVKGVTVGPSPDWLKTRLEALGQRSINNIVDATNYVMYDIGQPLHAFDARRLVAKSSEYVIQVRSAVKNEVFTALSGAEYALTEDTLVIGDGHSGHTLGIAGVKGGTAAEITSQTSDIIIESAHFNPVSIRKTAQRLKLWTDASQRFQNDPSPELAAYAMRQVIDLILKIAGGTLEGAADSYPKKQEVYAIPLSAARVNALLGTSMIQSDIEAILKRFGFAYEPDAESGLIVSIPFERLDLRIEEDLIEEIGRIYGYNKIPAEMPPALAVKPAINKSFAYTSAVRDALVAQGFSEIFTSSFRPTGSIEIENPLTDDKRFLRENLSESMKDALASNVRNADLLGLDQIKLFEISATFAEEGETLSLVLGVANANGFKKIKEADSLDEGFRAVGTALGIELTLDEPAPDNLFELNLNSILEDLPDPRGYYFAPYPSDQRYAPISAYPFLIRDIAVFIPDEDSTSDLERLLRGAGSELLVRMTLFDTFTKTFPDGTKKTSFAYRLIFQAHDRTLTDEEATAIMEKITAALNAQSGWQVR